jgi:hypothetical protein
MICIALPGLEPAALRSVTRDGRTIVQLRCPQCRQWADIDDDQLHGRVSAECPDETCGWHETHDLAVIAGLPADWIWL